MENAECDIKSIFSLNNGKPMNLQRFFPLFRDSILGLTYLHGKNIAHRDIKPSNILKVGTNSYKLTDYGEGINLTYKC